MGAILQHITMGSAVLMIIAILLQQRGASLGAGFGASGELYTTRRGIDKSLFEFTIVMAVIFIMSIIALINVILRPGVSLMASHTIAPLTTNINNPSVSRIAGRDRITRIGRIMLFKTENTSPARRNMPMWPSIWSAGTPLPSRRTATHRPNELLNQRIINTINCSFMLALV